MRIGRLFISMLPVLIAAAPPASQPADRAITLPEAKIRASAETMTELAGLPVINVKSIEQVLKLSIKNNDLLLDTSIEPTDQALVRIPYMPGVNRVTLMGTAPAAGEPRMILRYEFENRDFGTPGAIGTYTSASLAGGVLTLDQMLETLDDQTHHVQLIQNSQPGVDVSHVKLYVQITSEPQVKLELSGDNIAELREKHPGEVAKYLDPVFRALRQQQLLSTVDPRLAWQVFSDAFTPPADLAAKVKSLVARLGAENFKDRETASRELETLGQAAALLLMHADRTGLSDEQISRIDAFVSKYKLIPDDEVARRRRDANFLIDCLMSDDARIRELAAAQLSAVAGHPIEFDAAAPPEKREAMITRLRAKLGTPSTRQLKD